MTHRRASAPETICVPVGDASQVGDARRRALQAGALVQLDDAAAGRLAIVVTELATNLAKHAQQGTLLIRPVLEHADHRGVDVLSVDHGPGIADAAAAMRDGYSTGGTRGAGLGAVARMSDTFDVFSQPQGTVILARLWSNGAPRAAHARVLQVGAVNVPVGHEPRSGDGWLVVQHEGRTLVLVVDGLGHGAAAAEASDAAAQFTRMHFDLAPGELLERLHGALRATRGAAIAVCELEQVTRTMRFAGIGNISASLLDRGASRSLTSHPGIVGHQLRRVQEFSYNWPADALLVLHSDGVATRWRLDQYPGLALRHPSVVAGVLHRDFQRGRDDATVVVLREAQRESSMASSPTI